MGYSDCSLRKESDVWIERPCKWSMFPDNDMLLCKFNIDQGTIDYWLHQTPVPAEVILLSIQAEVFLGSWNCYIGFSGIYPKELEDRQSILFRYFSTPQDIESFLSHMAAYILNKRYDNFKSVVDVKPYDILSPTKFMADLREHIERSTGCR